MSDQPISTGRGRPKDEGKRRDIIDAARALFLQRGFHGTSMDALAKQACVSKATLYSHFVDKDALYSALIEDKMAAYQVDDFAARVSWDIEADLTYIARHLLELIYDPEALDMLRMVIAEGREGSDVPDLFVTTGPRRVLHQIEAYLVEQKNRGADYLGDAAADTELFSSLVIGHTPMIFALMGVAPPLSAAQREARAAEAVKGFLTLKRGA